MATAEQVREEALDRVRVGTRIRELRKAHSLTARDLANGIGCSEAHVFNIESGRSRATVETRLAIAELLNIGIEEIEKAS
jgi:transcriptional regulator with XRE-family HTH domain